MTFPLGGRPPGIGAGKDVFDVVVDQLDVQFAALLAIMPGQLRIGFPPKPVGCLLLVQEDEVIELGGMVAISGRPMETLVDTDSRWTTWPSWSCVTPMIMMLPPSQDQLPASSSRGERIMHKPEVQIGNSRSRVSVEWRFYAI